MPVMFHMQNEITKFIQFTFKTRKWNHTFLLHTQNLITVGSGLLCLLIDYCVPLPRLLMWPSTHTRATVILTDPLDGMDEELGIVDIMGLASNIAPHSLVSSGRDRGGGGKTARGREGEKEGGREGGREKRREGGREKRKAGEREGGRKGRREREWEGEKEGGREGGREKRKDGREGGKEILINKKLSQRKMETEKIVTMNP